MANKELNFYQRKIQGIEDDPEDDADASDKLLEYKPHIRLAIRRGRRFRRYLQRSDFVQRIARILITLYEMPRRPANAAEYMYNRIFPQFFVPIRQKGSILSRDREKIVRYVEDLEEENARLRYRLFRHNPYLLYNEVHGEYEDHKDNVGKTGHHTEGNAHQNETDQPKSSITKV